MDFLIGVAMKVLIVENEIYLAQSIAHKLEDAGFVCERAVTTKEALEFEGMDVLLISSSFNDYNFFKLLEEYRHKVIILMVSYINADTLSKPMEAGALDYVLKPFMIEEVIRKINHYWSYRRLTHENSSLKRYIKERFDELECDEGGVISKLPLFIKAKHQRCADSYVFKYSDQKKIPIIFMSLQTELLDLPPVEQGATLYLSGFEKLKKSEKQQLVERVRRMPVIISTTSDDEEVDESIFTVKKIARTAPNFSDSELFSIDEYIKFAILSNQDRYTDTELAKKLGISRKSLWEKRKKYGFHKN